MDLTALTVAEIRQLLDGDPQGPAEDLLQAMSQDSRAGVRELCRRFEKRRQQLLKEQKRLEELYFYESRLADRGIKAVAGVDEAGRGPLAGPVVAAAVILPLYPRIPGLNDSKQLTSAKRKALVLEIKKISEAWAVGVSTVGEIQQLNIYRASLLAMKRAVEGLKTLPGHILVDGFTIPHLEFPQTHIIGGDAKCASVAAASILAKVSRDELMELCHFMYPQYGFDRHKGYATPDHIQALHLYGPCSLHRRGFSPVSELLEFSSSVNGLP